MTAGDTFPRLLVAHATARPEAPALREKYLGIWQTWSWRDTLAETREIAAGLAALGFRRGQNLAIIGDNRPRLYMAFAAAQMLGGVAVPMYQDAIASELAFVLDDAEIEFAVVEDQEQVDKLLEARQSLPRIRWILFEDPRGLSNYTAEGLMSLDALRERGRAWLAEHPEQLDRELAAGRGEDVAVILYTSGTTGKPKGVVQTHAAMLFAARGAVAFDRLSAQENVLSYLPMAWVGDHLFSYAEWLVAGYTVNCPESADTVMIDLREIGPTYYFAPPRIFEGMLTNVMIRMEDAGRLKRAMFDRFMKVARRVGADLLDGKPVPLKDRLAYALGRLLVYGPLKNTLGLSRIRVAYTAGAAIGPDLFRFYRSLGINLKQLYGQTETCAYVTMQPDGQVKLDSVGKPAPGVEVKLAPNGEVLVRGPMVLKEYYKRPEATAEAIDAEGYFHTGDAGVFDADGHLKIIDRAKDVGRLANGTLFAPNYIENKLKFHPQIKEAVCFGHGKESVMAFINIDLTAVGNWAERRGLTYSGYVDLAGKPEVYDLIRGCVEQVNRELAQEGELAHSQIARFLILHKELDPDDDELTRTRKVRRRFIAEKYAPLVEALFSGKAEQYIETQVKFEDGRTGIVAANIRICDVVRVPVTTPGSRV
ncbi:MAG: AMP-binding protein [Casimicrobiaceae bacterium]|nr:AMP-binding protein [Casimicrobiaceae bacterium]MDW8311567.1 AMP-binding protein [Burkholderiales bacterium]